MAGNSDDVVPMQSFLVATWNQSLGPSAPFFFALLRIQGRVVLLTACQPDRHPR